VDFIKVDGSITRRLLAGGTADTKMKAVVRVGEALGIGVIAEGVEDQDVLVRLKALGVGYVQGFGILRPHPFDFIASPASQGDAPSALLQETT
jgi:EAL domain-containing protein (putative c-di-GMP-specific phosphodiesterase class I)